MTNDQVEVSKVTENEPTPEMTSGQKAAATRAANKEAAAVKAEAEAEAVRGVKTIRSGVTFWIRS